MSSENFGILRDQTQSFVFSIDDSGNHQKYEGEIRYSLTSNMYQTKLACISETDQRITINRDDTEFADPHEAFKSLFCFPPESTIKSIITPTPDMANRKFPLSIDQIKKAVISLDKNVDNISHEPNIRTETVILANEN